MIRKIILSTYLLTLITITGYSQKDVIDFLNFGLDDAGKLSEAYLNPYGEMLGVNLNSGWYTAASVHKLGGFDLTFSASYTTVPTSGKTFDVNKLGLTEWSLLDANNHIAPTMAGKMNESDIPQLVEDNTGITLPVPNGTGSNFMVSQMIQAGVGLPYHTEIVGRFMPKVSYGNLGNLQLWGVGIKHSVKDYIPVFKRLPVLQLSVLGAYTNFTGALRLGSIEDMVENTELNIKSNAYTGRLLLGANIPVFAFYTGIGYGNATSTFDINGRLVGEENSANLINMKFKTSGFDFNAGMRVRLGIIGIHADYSVGEYAVITGGIGISFR